MTSIIISTKSSVRNLKNIPTISCSTLAPPAQVSRSLVFDEIYHNYKGMVYNLCLNYLHNQGDSEDATQDIFVKIHKKLNYFCISIFIWSNKIESVNLSSDTGWTLSSNSKKKKKHLQCQVIFWHCYYPRETYFLILKHIPILKLCSVIK